MLSRVDGASNRARSAVRLPGRRRRDRAADPAEHAPGAPRRRDGRTARARSLEPADPAARWAGDLRRRAHCHARRAANGIRQRPRAVARCARRRGSDHARRRGRRPLRPAPGDQVLWPGDRGGDRRQRRRRREEDDAAVHRRTHLPQRRHHERRPCADRDRSRRDDERGQLLRRCRRARGRGLRDHRRGDGRDRLRSRPPAAGGAGGADGGGGARLPDLQLPARLELHGRLRGEPARAADGRNHGRGRRQDGGGRVVRAAPDPARGAVPGHDLRGAQAPEVQAADLPSRQRAFPSPHGPHRLLQQADDRLPVRLDADAGRARAGAAVRPLQRPQRPPARRLDARDARSRPARCCRQRVPRLCP
jgi:hypothetical protein